MCMVVQLVILSHVNCSCAGGGYLTLKFIISGLNNNFKAKGLLCVPPDVTVKRYTFCQHRVFVFVWISEQIAAISLYSINWLVFRRVCKTAKSGCHVCLSVRLHWTARLTGRTAFHEILYWGFFENLPRKVKFH